VAESIVPQSPRKLDPLALLDRETDLGHREIRNNQHIVNSPPWGFARYVCWMRSICRREESFFVSFIIHIAISGRRRADLSR
jgi:hypothetical protein